MAPFMLNSHPTGLPNDSQPIWSIQLIPIFMHNIYIYFAKFQIYFGSVAKIQPPRRTSHPRHLLMPWLAGLFRLFLYTIYLFMMNFFRILLRISCLEIFQCHTCFATQPLTTSGPAVRYSYHILFAYFGIYYLYFIPILFQLIIFILIFPNFHARSIIQPLVLL